MKAMNSNGRLAANWVRQRKQVGVDFLELSPDLAFSTSFNVVVLKDSLPKKTVRNANSQLEAELDAWEAASDDDFEKFDSDLG